jgi:hypothetical protein
MSRHRTVDVESLGVAQGSDEQVIPGLANRQHRGVREAHGIRQLVAAARRPGPTCAIPSGTPSKTATSSTVREAESCRSARLPSRRTESTPPARGAVSRLRLCVAVLIPIFALLQRRSLQPRTWLRRLIE